VNIDVMVMIRPRGGDFVYSPDEYDAMKSDIMAAKRMGMDGVVLGILDDQGRIDVERCRELILLAKPMQVTCHRAFDHTPDPMDALEACIAAGFDRILTSGRALSALQGKELLARLVQAADGRIIILAGVGINGENVAEIVRTTGVGEVHFSARVWRESDAERHNPGITLVDHLPSDNGLFIADPDRIRAVVSALAEI
ncbi:MAG: copper homeostasis protein CutC, partial [Bacteroidota bacterium]